MSSSSSMYASELLVIEGVERREMNWSQRKWHLLPPHVDEPEVVFLDGSSIYWQATEHPILVTSLQSLNCMLAAPKGSSKILIKEMLSISLDTVHLPQVDLSSPNSWILETHNPSQSERSGFQSIQISWVPLAYSLKSVPCLTHSESSLTQNALTFSLIPLVVLSPSDLKVYKPGSQSFSQPSLDEA